MICTWRIRRAAAAGGTVTVRNSGEKTLSWTVSDTVLLDQADIVHEFPVNWVSSYSTYAYPTP